MVAKTKTATKKPAAKKKPAKLTARQKAEQETRAKQDAFLADYEALCRKHKAILSVGVNWDQMPIDGDDESTMDEVCDNTWVQVECLGLASDDLIDIHLKKMAEWAYW